MALAGGETPSHHNIPIVRSLLDAVIATAFAFAHQAKDAVRTEWFATGLALWLGFEGLLRASEVATATRKLILLSTDFGEKLLLITVIITDAKTRRHYTSTQMVLIQNAKLCSWLKWFFQDKPSTTPLFAGGRARLLERFRFLLKFLNVDASRYNLGALRAGGATHRFIVERNVSALQFDGRWKQAATLHSYIQSAMAALSSSMLPPSAKAAADFGATRFAKLSQPPSWSL